MGRFYPKNFVLLLLLLIFLEAIYDSDSPGLVGGVGAMYMEDEHYVSCQSESQCSQGFRCDLNRNKCVCNNHFDSKRKNLRDRHAVFFDKKRGVCVAPIGKVCTLDPKDGLYQIKCVPYASCEPQTGKQLPDIFGLCQCESGFEVTEDHLCEPVPVILIPNPDGKPMPSMAHRVGAPVEENMEKGSDKNPYNGKGVPVITEEQENRNENIDRGSIDEVKKQWKPTVLKGASPSVKCSGYLFIVTMFISCFCYRFI